MIIIDKQTKRLPVRICFDFEIADANTQVLYVVPNNRVLVAKYFQVITPAFPNNIQIATDIHSNIDLSTFLSYELWDDTSLVMPPERDIDPAFTSKQKGASVTVTGKNSPLCSEQLIEQEIRFTESVGLKFPKFPSTSGVTYSPIPVRVIMFGDLLFVYVQDRKESYESGYIKPDSKPGETIPIIISNIRK